jgi:hypothetical protein
MTALGILDSIRFTLNIGGVLTTPDPNHSCNLSIIEGRLDIVP